MNLQLLFSLYPFIWQSIVSFLFTLLITIGLMKVFSIKNAALCSLLFMTPILVPLILPFRGQIGLIRWGCMLASADNFLHNLSSFHQALTLVCLLPPLLALARGFISYVSYKVLLRKTRVTNAEQEPLLFSILHELTQKAKIPLPRVFLLPVGSVNIFTCGTFRPVLAISPMLLTELPEDELEAVLAHEVAHLVRRDQIVSWIVSLLSTLMFYNPFLYPLLKKIGHEREKAADAFAVAMTHKPRVLANGLLRVIKLASESKIEIKLLNAPILKLTSGDALYERVTALLSEKKQIDNAYKYSWRIVVLFLCISLILNIAMLLPMFRPSFCIMMS